MQHPLPHLLRARLGQRRGDRHRRLRHRGVERGLAELVLDLLLLGLEQPAFDVRAQLRDVVEAGVDREVLVHLRQVLLLDLLDGDLKRRVAPGEVLGAVVGGELQLDRARLAGAGAEQALLEAGDQVAAAELDQLVAALAALERLAGACRTARPASSDGR